MSVPPLGLIAQPFTVDVDRQVILRPDVTYLIINGLRAHLPQMIPKFVVIAGIKAQFSVAHSGFNRQLKFASPRKNRLQTPPGKAWHRASR